MAFKGVDFSQWNGNVDFSAVKNSGVDFAIIRSSYGNVAAYPDQKDWQFENNVKKAKQVGLPFGIYHYSYLRDVESAKAEARGFVALLDMIQPIPYVVALDVEEQCQLNMSSADLEAATKAFIDIVEGAGYFCALYSYESFLKKYSADFRKRYAIWCANTSKKPSIDYGIHQYSFTGRVDGASGDVDMNTTDIDYVKIIRDGGFNGYPKNNTNSKTNNTEVKADTITPFDKYFAERIGVGLDYDGQYGIMCFDLANDYSVNLIGGKQFLGMGAYEIYTNFDNQPAHELYTKIPNTPEFVPAKGDIMVWGTGIGQWGHVAICTGEGDTTWFNSYDQNWGGKNEPVTLIKHNYNAVLGVLRPKDQTKVLGTGGLKGDANGDGKIDVSDIAKIAAHIKGVKAIEKKYADNADVDGNGRVDVGDIAAVSAHIKGVKAIKQDKPVEKPKPVEKKEVVYVVRKGDTLSSIAAEYGTSWAKIAEDNDIENANLIYAGQKLVIK